MKHTHHTHHSKHSEHSHHSAYEYSAGSPAGKAGHAADRAMEVHAEVSVIAYNIFLEEGSPEGRELQHWLQAEKQVPA